MYNVTPAGQLVRQHDSANIPRDPDNTDYALYLKWVREGNTATVLPAVVSIPTSVTMRQARLALLQAGCLDAVSAAVAQMGGAAVIEWEYAQVVERSSPLVAALALPTAEVDGLFTLAATL